MVHNIFKMIVLVMSCILLTDGTAKGMSMSLQVERVTKKYPIHQRVQNYADSKYGYVSYLWKGKERCIRQTLKGNKLKNQEITLGRGVRNLLKGLEYGCEWTDKSGNFFFLTKKSGSDRNYTGILNKVNKKGRLVKQIHLNQYLKITKESNHAYALFVERAENREVIVSYYDYGKSGYVIFDRNTGVVKKQIVYSRKQGIVECYQKNMLLGSTEKGKLMYAGISGGRKITLASGKKIFYERVKAFHIGKELPGETDSISGRSFSVFRNKIYLLTPEGYYQVHGAKPLLKKLASVSNVPFWSGKRKRQIVLSSLMVISEKKMVIQQGYVGDETDANYQTLWVGKVRKEH